MSNMFDLSGKVAFVTGASSGLGRQLSLALAEAGADVAIVARRVEKLEAVKAEIEEKGVKCYAHQCDITDNKQIKETVSAIEDYFGKIDILINNAGVGYIEPAESQSDETWLKTINLNLNAQYFVSREVARGMIKRGYGKIISLGSIHSSVAMAEFPVSAYAAAKGGIKMMTKALAVEWAKHGITVNAIGPAYFPSEMTGEIIGSDEFQDIVKLRCPMGRTGRTGELDGAILYFASDASSYTTGQLLSIDGGWTAI